MRPHCMQIFYLDLKNNIMNNFLQLILDWISANGLSSTTLTIPVLQEILTKISVATDVPLPIVSISLFFLIILIKHKYKGQEIKSNSVDISQNPKVEVEVNGFIKKNNLNPEEDVDNINNATTSSSTEGLNPDATTDPLLNVDVNDI